MRGHNSSCQRQQPRHIGAKSSPRQGLERCPVRLYEPLQTITFDDDSMWVHLADSLLAGRGDLTQGRAATPA